ncbi:MAG: hypothetical protein KDA97_07515 [Acidimicrobiales bacterium]|nr:hypothetical protein [Acidimicrobiales bacterium]
MSRPPLPFDLPLDRLRIVGWPDPVLDAVGHELHSAYVERFWLPVLGPSTTWLARLLARGLDADPEGFDLDLDATAAALGLGTKRGTNSPFLRSLARAGQFDLTRPAGPGALAVRTRVGSLAAHHLRRLPASLQAEHRRWTAAADAEPDDVSRRRRARRLALSLLELGEPPESTEAQLHRWRIHPAVAHEALRWATERHAEAAAAVSADDAA